MTGMIEETPEERFDRVRREIWLKNANLPERYAGTSWWEEFSWPEEDEAVIHAWLRMLEKGTVFEVGPDMGLGLLLDGAPGAGKTTRACKLVRDLISSMPTTGTRTRRLVYFTRFDGLVRLEKSTFGEAGDPQAERILAGIIGDADEMSIVRLLVLDDLGKEYKTNFTERIFENVLRARYDAGLPTVITTNLPLSRWAETYGPSVESFAHEAFVHVPMISPTGDRRRE